MRAEKAREKQQQEEMERAGPGAAVVGGGGVEGVGWVEGGCFEGLRVFWARDMAIEKGQEPASCRFGHC